MTFSCKHAAQLLSDSMDRRLSRRERFALGLHLLVCGMCRTYRRQLRLMRRLLRGQTNFDLRLKDIVATTSLSPEARQRISRALGNQP
jgi:hypothetical protein